jgi:preprotein translocase subunit SecA
MTRLHRLNVFAPSTRILRKAKAVANRVEDLKAKYRKMSNTDLSNMTNYFLEEIKKGKTLDDIMPDAFAVAREAC